MNTLILASQLDPVAAEKIHSQMWFITGFVIIGVLIDIGIVIGLIFLIIKLIKNHKNKS